MAGFKQTVLDHSPVLFLTFDGDQYDSFSRTLEGDPRQIIDESGWDNHGIFHSDDYDIASQYYGYRMGMQSLVDLEQFDQNAISFGFYGYQPNASPPQNAWPKAFVEVTHQSQYNFYNGADKMGSYTVGFMLRKVTDETNFRQNQPGQNTGSFRKTFVRKVGVCDIYYYDAWASIDYLYFVDPIGTQQVAINNLLSFYDRNHFFVFCWDVRQTSTDSYSATATIYMNARIVAQTTYAFNAGVPVPNTSQPTSWEVMGTINTTDPNKCEDRHTSDCRFDQFFVLDKALSPDEVARLHKKTKLYEEMVRYSNPHSYWKFDDAESTVLTTLVGNPGTNGTYLGGVAKVVRDRPGPDDIPGSKSVMFNNGGCALVRGSTAGNTYFNPSGDYSVGLWMNLNEARRGVIMSIQSDAYPLHGINLEWNQYNGNFLSGSLQFRVNEEIFLNATNVPSGWHYVNMIRRSGKGEIWVDGILYDTKDVPVTGIGSPGQVYFMGMLPGSLNVDGNLCHVELYNYALQPQEIRARAGYRKIYKVSGTVYVQGTPYQGTLRFINRLTGELVQQIRSDPSDGTYEAVFYDNTTLDMIASIPENDFVRPRAYGPLYPAQFVDPT